MKDGRKIEAKYMSSITVVYLLLAMNTVTGCKEANALDKTFGVKNIKVSIYDANRDGGESIGSGGIMSALKGKKGIAPACISDLSPETLSDSNVLILAMTRKFGKQASSSNWRSTIVDYVKNGGGLLIMYENVGFRGEIKKTLLPTIVKGVKVTGDRHIRPIKVYSITKDLQDIKIGYSGQINLMRGNDGVVILRNRQRENAGIMGNVGKGKVVALGFPLGVDRSGKDRAPSGMELRLLVNTVRWLASEQKCPEVKEYIECRTLKPLSGRPSRIIEKKPPSGKRFRAGAAKVDVTPSGSVKLAGFSGATGRQKHGTQNSTGIHTRLYVKALVLDDGKEKIALVSWDSITGPRQNTIKKIRKRIKEKTGIPERNVIVNASHTHSGHYQQWEDQTVEAVCKACENLNDARIGIGSRMVYGIATATYQVAWDGTVKQFWGANQPNPDGVVDHECGVIRVEDYQRNLIAVWTNYACVGSTAGPRSSLISGDYMGVAMREIEKKYPGAVALFAQGFAGDSRSHGFRKERTVAEASRLGKHLAAEVIDITNHVDVKSWVKLHGKIEKMKLPGRTTSKKKWGPFNIELQGIAIDNCVIIATAWEIFPEIGIEIKEKSPFEYTFCLELSNNSWIEYLPHQRAYLQKPLPDGRPAIGSRIFVPQTSETLIKEALGIIKEMGKLK